MSRRDLRIEDVLTILAALALVVTGVKVQGLAEGRWWEYSFVVFPAALMILGASIRYAFGGTESGPALARIGHVIRDWLPFALFLTFYETLRSQLWASLATREMDATLLHIDRMLFGETPAISMQSWISPAATEFFATCYFIHLLLPPLVAFFWYRRDVPTFRWFLLSIFACGAVGSGLYIAVPAVGPGIAFKDLFTVPLKPGAAMDAVALMDSVGRAPHDVFPSLHIAVAAIVLYFAFRYSRWMGFVLFPLIAGNWISTLYLRYHYAIDDLAGFVLAFLTIVAAAWLLKLEHLWQRPG